MSNSLYLQHYGVKGMKWGVRKRRDVVNKPKRMSRKEVRNINRQRRQEHNAKRAEYLLSEAATKKKDVLIAIRTPYDKMNVPTIVTGTQFVDYMTRGGVLNIEQSDIFATKDSSGTYVRNQNAIPVYEKVRR